MRSARRHGVLICLALGPAQPPQLLSHSRVHSPAWCAPSPRRVYPAQALMMASIALGGCAAQLGQVRHASTVLGGSPTRAATRVAERRAHLANRRRRRGRWRAARDGRHATTTASLPFPTSSSKPAAARVRRAVACLRVELRTLALTRCRAWCAGFGKAPSGAPAPASVVQPPAPLPPQQQPTQQQAGGVVAPPAEGGSMLPAVSRERVLGVCAQVSGLVAVFGLGLRQLAPAISPAARDGHAELVTALTACESRVGCRVEWGGRRQGREVRRSSSTRRLCGHAPSRCLPPPPLPPARRARSAHPHAAGPGRCHRCRRDRRSAGAAAGVARLSRRGRPLQCAGKRRRGGAALGEGPSCCIAAPLPCSTHLPPSRPRPPLHLCSPPTPSQVLAPLGYADLLVVGGLPALSEELLFRGALIPAVYPDWCVCAACACRDVCPAAVCARARPLPLPSDAWACLPPLACSRAPGVEC